MKSKLKRVNVEDFLKSEKSLGSIDGEDEWGISMKVMKLSKSCNCLCCSEWWEKGKDKKSGRMRVEDEFRGDEKFWKKWELPGKMWNELFI